PLAHVFSVGQPFLSLEGAVLSVCAQPVAGTQLSSVHTFPSSQLGGAPPTQLPPAHVSFVVQALLSLQGAVLFVCAQPVAGTQLSAVHTFPPSHWHGAPSTQLSPAHMSFVV